MSIPIGKKTKEILNKRSGEFPRKISSQRYNEYIKTVCEKAGITQLVDGSKIDPKTNRLIKGKFRKCELVSSHIGRRSFASNSYGFIPTSIIQYITGHTTEASLLIYIGKTQNEKALDAAGYFE